MNVVTNHDFPGKQLWVFQAKENIEAMTLDSNNQIIVRTVNSIFSLSVTKGQLIWSDRLPKTFGGGGPIISSEIVIVAHAKGTNAYNLKTGELLWQATDNTSRGHRTFVATANSDIVVIVGGFIAVRDIKTGKLLWTIERAVPGIGALASLNGDNLYIVFLNVIQSYDTVDRRLISTVTTPPWSLESVLLQDGVLYLENSLHDGVGAFDVETQKMIWHQKRQFTTFSNPITKYDNHLFVPVKDGHPIALNAETGEVLWKARDVPKDIYLTSAVMDEIVYVKSLFKRNLYALNLQNGDVIGYLNLGLPNIFPSARETSIGPFLSDSSIIFADNKRVFAYEKR